ncbi:DUF4129 domain-containing protein [Hymenobacter sp. HMF4947]|uniref:DUF4129 domain-containing protein n=1 Tax=Hymenobacter ginkgonis TaxID=2682976 RepID=A0A7K1TJH3_9BACT|nr:DUF4129 domain-containing protein [Hymenobacter ginkgonis]MVN78522.1 DUF4129 domain-containing protein [Hymenobacter ginkgonis]
MRKVNIKLLSARTGGALALLLALGGAPALATPPQLPAALPSLSAPADTATAPPLPPDAAVPQPVRRPAASHLRELRGQHDFQYTDVREEPEQAGFWARLLRWFFRGLSRLFDTKGGRVAWDVILYLLIGGGLVYAVLKFLQVDLTKVFGRAPRALPLAYEAGQENIHALDFSQAIAQAEATGNLRLAVRLGYLQLLKQLTDRELIAWQPDKTNQAYLRELETSRPTARAPFAELTRQFEYIWYGELPLPAALYAPVRESQRQFGQQLSGAGVRPPAA